MQWPEELSYKGFETLKYIWRYFQKNGRPPAFREIEGAIGVNTTSAVAYHVRILVRKGYLRRDRNVARGLSLTDKARDLLEEKIGAALETGGMVRLQISGDIVAGQPVQLGNGSFSTYSEEDTIGVDANLLPSRSDDLYALRVHGESMIDALVNDGDIVILKKVHEAVDGEMVAAWLPLDDEMTLKHIYFEGQTIRLQPANPTLKPIYVPASNVEIHGKVIFVQRQM